jgi:hypothetical protein
MRCDGLCGRRFDGRLCCKGDFGGLGLPISDRLRLQRNDGLCRRRFGARLFCVGGFKWIGLRFRFRSIGLRPGGSRRRFSWRLWRLFDRFRDGVHHRRRFLG